MILSKAKLETFLAKKCMTYTELSNKSKVSRITLKRLVDNKVKSRPITVGKIAKALNIKVEDLVE